MKTPVASDENRTADSSNLTWPGTQEGKTDEDALSSAVCTILENTQGEIPGRNGLQDTPLRFARAWADLTEGYSKTPQDVVGDAIFGEAHRGMIVVKDIPIYSICERHLLPFMGKAHVAYIPDPEKGIIGLSKFNRITEVFARRLQLQERLTSQILDAIDNLLQPEGVGVVLECRHMCMDIREDAKPFISRTEEACGVFHNETTWQEFMTLVFQSTGMSRRRVDTRGFASCAHSDEHNAINGIEMPAFRDLAKNDKNKEDSIASAARIILETTRGESPGRIGLQMTPLRFARVWSELTNGYTNTAEDIVARDATREIKPKGMIVAKDIPIQSLCEHHLLPFMGKAHVAYIPDPEKGTLDSSQLRGIAKVFARRLQVQERLTTQIMEALQDVVQPKGVGVVVECRHMCMEMRGVESPSTTVTKTSCGVFDEDVVWKEFMSLAFDMNSEEFTPPSNLASCYHGTEESYARLPSETPFQPNQHVLSNNDADDYRIYQRCAQEELSAMTRILETVIHPCSTKAFKNLSLSPFLREKKTEAGCSILDIGAGNGWLLKNICTEEAGLAGSIARYAAYEPDESLRSELMVVANKLGFHNGNSTILGTPFTLATRLEEVGGASDIVILGHCLYGNDHKEQLVERALDFVAPGGVLLIFHHWAPGGTLDLLSEHLNSKCILHHREICDIKLDLSTLEPIERDRLAKYTKAKFSSCKDPGNLVAIRTIGCVAIEPHSCNLIDNQSMAGAIVEARKKVGYLARRNEPAAVISPTSVIGIQASLRSASLQTINGSSRGVTVIGGGHSENCLADYAIAINMEHWNHVIVDESKLGIRVGGGATIGAITRECQKHGLVVPLGDRPSVGVGLILQGGLNHIMRRFGLACDTIIRVVYVTPRGELKVADKEEDLFRFRGAGSNFGVVLELTLRAFKLETILAQDIQYILPSSSLDSGGLSLLTSYSREAVQLKETACLDGFLFWSSRDCMSFATSYFDTQPDVSNASTMALPLLADAFGRTEACSVMSKSHESEPTPGPGFEEKLGLEDREGKGGEQLMRIIRGQPQVFLPTELFDRELYMTQLFDMERTAARGSNIPTSSNNGSKSKLRSIKRCLLLPPLGRVHESLLCRLIRTAPTKWCYVHFLHGGGAVAHFNNDHKDEDFFKTTAFGCRNWAFAAVITARWLDRQPDNKGNIMGKEEEAASKWLEYATLELLPHSVGVYGADLGPLDSHLAQFSFGQHSLRLAETKRMEDPLNLFRFGCPLRAANTTKSNENLPPSYDPRIHNRGVVVIFCGRRCAGKDWLAEVARDVLERLIGQTNSGDQHVSIVRISDETKRAYAEEHHPPGVVDGERLIREREYKDAHRKSLIAYYHQKKTHDPAYDARCFVNCVQKSESSILLLTGMRDGIQYARSLAGRAVVLVKVTASGESKQERGWKYCQELDESPSECAVDCLDDTIWDACYDNGAMSTKLSAREWATSELAPVILRQCARLLSDTPQPGIEYKDFVGNLFLQPFGLSLCNGLILHWLQEDHYSKKEGEKKLLLRKKQSSSLDVDAIVAPEALGFVFAAPLAVALKKPLILLRKHDKLPGVTHKVRYSGSNMNNLSNPANSALEDLEEHDSCSLEVVAGSIQPEQRVLVVDDCLASGSTLEAIIRLVEEGPGSAGGGIVAAIVCVMEFPDLLGRQRLLESRTRDTDLTVHSLVQFAGK